MQPGRSLNSWSLLYFADPVLRFLLSNIQDPKISSITALAISSICMSCYSQMTKYFDVLAQVKNILKKRIFYSVLVQVKQQVNVRCFLFSRPFRISFGLVALTLTRFCILKKKESEDSREGKKKDDENKTKQPPSIVCRLVYFPWTHDVTRKSCFLNPSLRSFPLSYPFFPLLLYV